MISIFSLTMSVATLINSGYWTLMFVWYRYVNKKELPSLMVLLNDFLGEEVNIEDTSAAVEFSTFYKEGDEERVNPMIEEGRDGDKKLWAAIKRLNDVIQRNIGDPHQPIVNMKVESESDAVKYLASLVNVLDENFELLLGGNSESEENGIDSAISNA